MTRADDDETPIAEPAMPVLTYRVRKPSRPTVSLAAMIAPAAFVALLIAAIVCAWVAGLFFALLHATRVGAIVMAVAGATTFVGILVATLTGHRRRERDYAAYVRRVGPAAISSTHALESPDAQSPRESPAGGMAHLARAAGRATAKIHRRLQGDAGRRTRDR